ncbi:MAG: hypothetical protein ACI97N_002140, partial [Cognaticolwellia sp.]
FNENYGSEIFYCESELKKLALSFKIIKTKNYEIPKHIIVFCTNTNDFKL